MNELEVTPLLTGLMKSQSGSYKEMYPPEDLGESLKKEAAVNMYAMLELLLERLYTRNIDIRTLRREFTHKIEDLLEYGKMWQEDIEDLGNE